MAFFPARIEGPAGASNSCLSPMTQAEGEEMAGGNVSVGRSAPHPRPSTHSLTHSRICQQPPGKEDFARETFHSAAAAGPKRLRGVRGGGHRGLGGESYSGLGSLVWGS